MIIWILDNFETDNGFFSKLFKYSSKNDQVSKVLMLSITSNPDLNVYVSSMEFKAKRYQIIIMQTKKIKILQAETLKY